MSFAKKLMAVILIVSVLCAAVVMPISAIVDSSVSMPTNFALIENFDGENTLSWVAQQKATLEFSDASKYGTSGKSAHIYWSERQYNGMKTNLSNANVTLTGDGLAFWANNPGDDLANFFVVLTQGGVKYEAKFTITKGEAVYTIPWAEFVKDGAAVSTNAVVTQIVFQHLSNAGEVYIDQIGCYATSQADDTPNNEPTTPVEMPDNFTVIENFDGENTLSWVAQQKATLEFSNASKYGTSGKSAHIYWSERQYNGMKTNLSNANVTLTGDGLAFWANNPGDDLANFFVVLTQGGVKYEAKFTITKGEAVYTIPWAEFVKDGAAVSTNAVVTQIVFQHLSNAGEVYIDQIGCYATSQADDTPDNEPTTPVEMPEYYYIIDDFNSASEYNWKASGTATYELSTVKKYGADGSSAHVSWSTRAWSGAKTTVTNANIELIGDGITFWAYNAGAAVDVYVKLKNADNAYEKKIALTAGENVYTIPYAEFKKNDVAIDVTKLVAQIEFTSLADAADYYIDELACYSTTEIKDEEPTTPVEMPEYYYIIDDFNSTSEYNWKASGTATYELSTVKKYGADGSSAHVSWSTRAWSGAKTTVTNANIELIGDGITFWAYNAGAAVDVYVKLKNADNAYEKKIALTAGENVYTIPYAEFKKNDVAIDVTKLVAQIEFTSLADAADYYIDELACYSTTEIKDEEPSTSASMPECYFIIDDFNTVSEYNWKASGTASYELSNEKAYSESGKSAHVLWSERGWSGFKTTVTNANVVLKGNGIAFWAYNPGNNLDVYVKLRNADAVYEKKITLTSGEAAYTISYEEFKKDGQAIDVTKTVTQIEFTSIADAAEYYVDELSYYSDFVFSSQRLPDSFDLIEDFDDDSLLNWSAHGKATYQNYDKRGYGSTGNSAHVTWTESGWSGIKTTVSNANLALTGEGIAFWAYNAGESLDIYIKLRNVDGVFEKKITLNAGEGVYKIPYSEFKKDGNSIDVAKTISQIELTSNSAGADYYIDQVGCYVEPVKPATSTILFDTSTKCSTSAVGGSGNGGKGGYDTVKWKLYEIKDDPRFTRGCWFVAEDVTSGIFSFMNVSKIGLTEGVDLSAAQYFGNLTFWIKSDTANRSLKVALRNELSGQFSQYVEFTVTEANKWQQVTIPVSELVTDSILEGAPDFLKNVKVISFTGKDVEGTFEFGEEFKIAGLRIYDSDVPDYSEYDGFDTEPTQPADDGSYSTDPNVIGHLDFAMDTYSGNPNFGTVTMQEYDEFATLQNGVKIVFGDGIRNDQMPTKGLSIWFGEAGTANTVDASSLEDGYFSMWVRGSRAGMSFYFIMMDDTVNDARSSIVRTYTIKEANTWEEVRIRLCDYLPYGALDTEYVYMMSIRTGYGAFNWGKAYQDDQWLQEGDVLELTCASITEGKPYDPFVTVFKTDETDTDKKPSDNSNNSTNGGNDISNNGQNNVTDNTLQDDVSPNTSDSVAVFITLLTFAFVSGLIATLTKCKIKMR